MVSDTAASRLREPPLAAPRIKVVIPTRDRLDLLEKAMAGIRLATGVAADLVVVDNGSTELQSLRYLAALADTGTTVVRVDEPFNFSRLINRGARSGPRADYLLMLNNDTSMAHPEWLSRLSGWLRDPGVVGVGPKLHFPDGRIQHAGMVMGLGGIAGHYALGERRTPRFGPPEEAREVSCLTGACLLVRMADFEAVGGLDEDFAIDFQDVDLCLRLRRQLGGDLIYDPTHPLTHVQMASRDPGAAGSEDTIARMRANWGAVLDEPDQIWNPHLSLISPGKDLAMLPSDPDVLRSRLAPRVRVSSRVA
jgi:GT2 family glycosyltransferase